MKLRVSDWTYLRANQLRKEQGMEPLKALQTAYDEYMAAKNDDEFPAWEGSEEDCPHCKTGLAHCHQGV